MLNFFIKALVALFTIVDPVGLVPVVLALTVGMLPHERTLVIIRATIIAGIVIAVFGAFGRFIFTSLGVTSEAFSIAGGALLFVVAFDMLFGRPSGARETRREAREALTREDVSVFPLAIPMIAGPGTITTIKAFAASLVYKYDEVKGGTFSTGDAGSTGSSNAAFKGKFSEIGLYTVYNF